jgi:chromosome segregation protein
LAREREIHEREAALAADETALARQGVEMEALSTQLHSLEQARREAQQQVNQGHRDHAQAQGRLQAAQSRAETACTRRAALAEECAELDEQNASDQEQLQQARLRLEEVLLELESDRTEQVALGSAREQHQQQVRQCRVVAETARQAVARGQAALEALRLQWTATDAALERLEAQQRQLRERQQRLDTEPGTVSDDSLVNAEAELGEWLETRLIAESALQEARQDLASRDASLQALEQERSRSEREIDTQRQRIEAQRLALGEIRVREQHLCEQLQALDTTPEALVPTLPAVAEESAWLARLEQLERRIQRLGPINLAAIDEFAQLSERKQYLDAQDADLLEALAILENAMRKIDRETRARFRETFEQVNTGLQELFPRLFGGGQAHLELTQEDVLEAGVTIMAKPPGKRIGSITLLSGGEKALTAVALVFAIFQLNPAPFCLLDEVDAPLDEANVGRFGALVRDMATRVQFIFITHNKATMEIAQHLIGVTMQEPGVSRLVAVDVDAAAQLAGVG